MRCGAGRYSGPELEQPFRYRTHGGAETGGIKLHYSRHVVVENNFIRKVGAIDPETSNVDAIWLDARNSQANVRNNVIVETEGNSILMEANGVGPNYIENNIVVGGLLATYSSRDTVWRYNLFVDAPGHWVNQDFGNRPTIEGAIWSNNIFISRGVA